jgi:hypothetical protein
MKCTTMLPAVAVLLAVMLAGESSMSAHDQYKAESAPAVAPNEVAPGTRFLIDLQDALNTAGAKAGDRFHARTIEPLISADGTGLPIGAEIRGHVDKVEAAHKTGRARMWLTFDDIKTPDGWIPLVAMVTDVPGVHSIRVDYNREGEIEASSSKRQEAFEAAAAGAFVGAAAGVATHNEKDAAIGAATAAAAAFMVASGLGQEVTLQKDTKIELILERSLYFGR